MDKITKSLKATVQQGILITAMVSCAFTVTGCDKPATETTAQVDESSVADTDNQNNVSASDGTQQQVASDKNHEKDSKNNSAADNNDTKNNNSVGAPATADMSVDDASANEALSPEAIALEALEAADDVE